ncbi:MAG: hypothetical protein ACKV1O_24295 [Saprospiraceae bacterium]
MNDLLSRVYFFLFMPFVTLKKNAPAKLFLVPTFILSFLTLLLILIVSRIINFTIQDISALYIILISQVFFYIVFYPIIPLNISHEELKIRVEYSPRKALRNGIIIASVLCTLGFGLYLLPSQGGSKKNRTYIEEERIPNTLQNKRDSTRTSFSENERDSLLYQNSFSLILPNLEFTKILEMLNKPTSITETNIVLDSLNALFCRNSITNSQPEAISQLSLLAFDLKKSDFILYIAKNKKNCLSGPFARGLNDLQKSGNTLQIKKIQQEIIVIKNQNPLNEEQKKRIEALLAM